jgi:AraC-like DNA-binding protein
MKPILMRHTEPSNESFKAWTNANPYHHNPWHYHPECEITAIEEGRGMLFAGDKVTSFEKDDLVLIGPNVPHEYRSSMMHTPDYFSQSIAVHFRIDFPGSEFYKMPEAKIILQLLEQSKRGIKFNDPATKKMAKEQLAKVIHAKGIVRVNILFSILEALALAPKREYLSSQSFIDSIDEGQDIRMNTIYKNVMAHFRNEISLDQLSSEVNMTKTSFCRFFKKRTNKSFVQYVNEIRVGYACKLLLTEKYNIAEAAYESGFENISNFNKQFLKIKKSTPSQMLAQYKKNEASL